MPRQQERELLGDARALLGVFDRRELEPGAREAEQRIGKPRERAPQRHSCRVTLRGVAHRRSNRRSKHQRRFISRPTAKPMPAAMPIACHGWSWT